MKLAIPQTVSEACTDVTFASFIDLAAALSSLDFTNNSVKAFLASSVDLISGVLFLLMC